MAAFTYLSIFKTKWIIWTVCQEVSHSLNLLPKEFQWKCHGPLTVSQIPKPSAVPFIRCVQLAHSALLPPFIHLEGATPSFHHPLASLWKLQTSNSPAYYVLNHTAKRTTLQLVREQWAIFRFSWLCCSLQQSVFFLINNKEFNPSDD